MCSTKTTCTLGRIVALAFLGLAVVACYPPGNTVPPQPGVLASPQPEPPGAAPTIAPPQGNGPSTPLVVTLTMDKAPRLGEEAQVVLELQAFMDAPGTTAHIELPVEAELVTGDLDWEGDVMVNKPVRLAATIVFNQEGAYMIRGSALRPVDAGMTWGDAEDIFLTVRQDGSFFGLEDGGDTQLSASPEPTSGN